MDGYDLSEFFADDNVSFVHTFAAHTQTIPSLQDSFLAVVAASTRLNSSAKKILQTVTVTRDSLVFKMLFSIPVRTVGTKSTITLSEHDLRDRWNGSIASSVVKTPDPSDKTAINTIHNGRGFFESTCIYPHNLKSKQLETPSPFKEYI